MDRILQILLVDDEEIVHQTIGDYLKDLGHEVSDACDGKSAIGLIDKKDYDLALIDVRMPGMDGFELLDRIQKLNPEISIVIITGHGSMEMAIQALRLGAADFLTKPVKLLDLDAVLEKAVRIRELKKKQKHLRETISGIQSSLDARVRQRAFVGRSVALEKVREQIGLSTEANCETILITGETGTGKEVVAREIHFMGGHDDSPFIAVSCPAIPDTLLESELFGHVKGSFTGADMNKAGSFELADGGTLFLDEIGDLSQAAQAKLLRVLETRTVRRVGGTKEKEVNVRVVAATNAPLGKMVKEGKFRQDLFYRLNAFSIHIPPLRERKDDILPLAHHFLSSFKTSKGINIEGFSTSAEQVLIDYDFPGNARELKNIVERAAILCKSGRIHVEHLHLPMGNRETGSAPMAQPSSRNFNGNGEMDERSRLLSALEKCKWNRKMAAQKLDMPYSTFRYKLKKHDIK